MAESRSLLRASEAQLLKIRASHKASAEMKVFSHGMTHDLVAPLRSIRGYAEALMEDYGQQLDAQATMYLQRITASANRVDSMIRDIAAYMSFMREEVALVPVDLNQVMRDIINTSPRLQIAKANIHLEGTLLPVFGNETALIAVIMNLLDNALKFVPADIQPHVEVWTESLAQEVKLYIRDRGIGIAPEHRERIFGLMERLHAVDKYEGTGMGLSIVRKAVEQMNGKVDFESEPGVGSTFWVQLKKA